MTNPTITAVVVTHNRPSDLVKNVSALNNQSRPPNNIIIIDNASEIPATETLRNFKNIEIHRSVANLGGAGGFAKGIKIALQQDTDWIWLMDDDAIPARDALENLIHMIDTLPDRTGAICSSVYENRQLALRHRRRYARSMALEFPIPESRYTDKAPVAIDTGSFVGFLLNAAAAYHTGLPNTSFFIAYDDTDYSLRLRDNGWLIWLAPTSRIKHLRPTASRLRESTFSHKHYYNVRNRIVVANQHGKPALLATSLATIQGLILWLACGGLRGAGFRIFIKAIADGWKNQLGTFDND